MPSSRLTTAESSYFWSKVTSPPGSIVLTASMSSLSVWSVPLVSSWAEAAVITRAGSHRHPSSRLNVGRRAADKSMTVGRGGGVNDQ